MILIVIAIIITITTTLVTYFLSMILSFNFDECRVVSNVREKNSTSIYLNKKSLNFKVAENLSFIF